jgi:hypothetical protein
VIGLAILCLTIGPFLQLEVRVRVELTNDSFADCSLAVGAPNLGSADWIRTNT